MRCRVITNFIKSKVNLFCLSGGRGTVIAVMVAPFKACVCLQICWYCHQPRQKNPFISPAPMCWDEPASSSMFPPFPCDWVALRTTWPLCTWLIPVVIDTLPLIPVIVESPVTSLISPQWTFATDDVPSVTSPLVPRPPVIAPLSRLNRQAAGATEAAPYPVVSKNQPGQSMP